jgi:flagellar M-ring protein FliF
VNGVLAALQKFGIGRLAMVGGVAAGVIAVLAAIMLRAGNEPMSLLYANLDLREASSITAALDAAGTPYELKGDGSTILVARDEVAATRLKLSAEGLPTSGSVGYEIFDEAPAMGQTDFVQQLNRQRALEGELARTIRTLRGVSAARVHLVLPKRQLFEEDAEQPSATIVVGLAGGSLTPDNVRSLRNLVAGAVPGLKADRVTLIDENNELLASGAEGADGFDTAQADSQRGQLEGRLTATVKELVEGVVGAGKAKIKVSADLDLARVTVSEETYDPDGQVVRSTTTAEEKAQESNKDPAAATVAENIPGADGADGAGSSSANDRTEETTNYEISKTNRTEVQEPGRVRRLSVAVAVDGISTPGPDGTTTYAPRPAAEMQQIEQLVRSAVGFDAARGDVVTVQNVRFNRAADGVGGTEAASPLAGFDKNDLMRAAELGVLALTAALLILFVVRPLMKGATAQAAGHGHRDGDGRIDGGRRSGAGLRSADGRTAGDRRAALGDGAAARPGPHRGAGEGVLGQETRRVRRQSPRRKRRHPAHLAAGGNLSHALHRPRPTPADR